jgi:uncharacterized protein with PQ loop repeat
MSSSTSFLLTSSSSSSSSSTKDELSSPSSCTCLSLTHSTTNYDELAALMGECLWTTRERASFYIGLLSVLCWLICQFPQIISNYRRGEASGLSKWLLLQWIVGDSLNLIGTFLTKQLAFQKIASVMFVILDIMMIIQRLYYVYWVPLSSSKYHTTNSNNRISLSSNHVPLLTTTATATATLVAASTLLTTTAEATTLLTDPDSILTLHLLPSCETEYDVTRGAHFFGLVCGWLATMMYIGSRISQIIQIRRTKSVEGISILMFCAAVLGNITYGSALLLRDSSWNGISKSLPWVVGSWGVMFLDCFILFHFLLYGDNSYIIY